MQVNSSMTDLKQPIMFDLWYSDTADDTGVDDPTQGDKKLTFTPEQFKDRLDRAKSKAAADSMTALLKELGAEKAEDIKTQLAELAKVKQDRLTKEDQLRVALEEVKKSTSALEQEKASLAKEVEELRFEREFSSAASKSNLADKHHKLLTLDYKVNGGDLSVEEFLKLKAKESPELFKKVETPATTVPTDSTTPKPPKDGAPPAKTGIKATELTKVQYEQWKRAGFPKEMTFKTTK